LGSVQIGAEDGRCHQAPSYSEMAPRIVADLLVRSCHKRADRGSDSSRPINGIRFLMHMRTPGELAPRVNARAIVEYLKSSRLGLVAMRPRHTMRHDSLPAGSS